MPLILPNDLSNGQVIDAAPVQANFETIETHVNSELINRDGSVAFTQPQVGVTPTLSTHLVTKQYVDDRLQGPVAYTPALQGSSGNPNIGSTGTASGKWWQIGTNLYVVEFGIEFGGTGITQGSGNVRITLPFAAAKVLTTSIGSMQGVVTVNDASASQARILFAYVNTHGDQFVVLKGVHSVGYSTTANFNHVTTSPTVGITYAAGDDFSGKLFFTKA